MSIYDKSSLVLIPSGTKTGKIFSQKPVSGDGDFTFTRASAATRVNADGNIEKETSNLLLQSNQLDTSWDKVGITTTSGQSGYDGSNDAWLITKTPASYERIRQNNTSSGVLTASVYAKANTLNQVTIYCFVSGSNAYAKFSLVDGSVVLSSSIIDSSATNVGNGWWRLSITFNDTLQSINIYPDLAETTAGSIYIQDAQLEQGLVARDYIETTTAAVYGGITDNTPRLDYTDSSCPALLLEPLRTNFIGYSEAIEFGISTNECTQTITNETNPSGKDLSYLASAIDNNNDQMRYDRNGLSSGSYFLSAFVKGDGNANKIRFRGTGGGISVGNVYWDVSADGTITLNASQSPSGVNAITEDYGNGWYRIGFEETYDGTSTSRFALYPSNGDVNASTYIWGIQWEQGSYATSYIPTYGSSVTRVYENQDATGLSTSVFNNDNFTLLYDFDYNANGREGSTTAYRIFSGSSQLGIKGRSGSSRSVEVYSSGNFSGSIVFNNYGNASRIKVALRVTNGTCELFFNGVKDTETIDVSGAAPYNWSQITMLGSSSLNTSLNQCLGFPTALTDQELIDLTTL
jgi:hypothetical protein